jgi:hypothetical protein
MTKRRSKTESKIPLWLLPHAIACQIREWGGAMYRISVKRTHWHHYNVTVRTKRIKKELATIPVAVLDAVSGTGSGEKYHAAKKGRRCAV